jgi:hypothetical protein
MRFGAAWALAVIMLSGCGFGSGAEFRLTNANVQPNYVCPSTTSDAPYELHATVVARNGTSTSISIKSVSAVMTLAAVHGAWLQKVGYKYDAATVVFVPDRVAAGSSATLDVTIPSSCRSKTSGALSYADYSVELAVVTSTGTFKTTSRNRHRIIA